MDEKAAIIHDNEGAIVDRLLAAARDSGMEARMRRELDTTGIAPLVLSIKQNQPGKRNPYILEIFRELLGEPRLTMTQIQADYRQQLQEIYQLFSQRLLQCGLVSEAQPHLRNYADSTSYLNEAAITIAEHLPAYVVDRGSLAAYANDCPLIRNWINKAGDMGLYRNDQERAQMYTQLINLIDQLLLERQARQQAPQEEKKAASRRPSNVNPPPGGPISQPIGPSMRPLLNPQQPLAPFNGQANPAFNQPNPALNPFEQVRPPSYQESKQAGMGAGIASIAPVQQFNQGVGLAPSRVPQGLTEDEIENSPMYFNTQYMPPIMHQFTELVHDQRKRGERHATLDRDLLRQMDALQMQEQQASGTVITLKQQLKQLQDRYERDIEKKAAPVLKTIMNPLYLFYTRNWPSLMGPQNQNIPVGQAQEQYPEYAYFMGLSELMLEGIGDMARVLSNQCANQTKQLSPNARYLLRQFSDCKSAQMDAFRQLIDEQKANGPNGSMNPETLYTRLGEMLTSASFNQGMLATPAQQTQVRQMLDKIFLVQESKDERQVANQLQSELKEVQAMRSAQGAQDGEYKRRVTDEIQDELNLSQLRLRLITQIQERIGTLLRIFFQAGATVTWSEQQFGMASNGMAPPVQQAQQGQGPPARPGPAKPQQPVLEPGLGQIFGPPPAYRAGGKRPPPSPSSPPLKSRPRTRSQAIGGLDMPGQAIGQGQGQGQLSPLLGMGNGGAAMLDIPTMGRGYRY